MATIIKYNEKVYPIPSSVNITVADAIGVAIDMGNPIVASDVDVTETMENGNRVLTITNKPKTKG